MRGLQSLCAVAVTTLSAVSAFAPRVARPIASSWTTTTSRHFSSTSLSMSAAQDFAKKEIADNKVVIFSKSFCPFCKKTKKVFAELSIEATIYELNQMDDGADIQEALLEMSGQRTVPNVFINGEHVGGNDDVQKAKKSGKLETLLASA